MSFYKLFFHNLLHFSNDVFDGIRNRRGEVSLVLSIFKNTPKEPVSLFQERVADVLSLC